MRGGATDDPSRRDRIRVGKEGPRERDERERVTLVFFHFLEENKETRRWGVGLPMGQIWAQVKTGGDL